jgi:hypothetical protein
LLEYYFSDKEKLTLTPEVNVIIFLCNITEVKEAREGTLFVPAKPFKQFNIFEHGLSLPEWSTFQVLTS